MGFTVERTGFVGVEPLANSLISDLTANGFNMIHPNTGFSSSIYDATVEATGMVDSLADDALPEGERQKWRIKVKAAEDKLKIFCATPVQLGDSGQTANYNTDWVSGELQKSSGDRYFLDRTFGVEDEDPEAHTLAYRLTITSRGVAFLIWQENSHHLGNRFSWFVVQRPVNHNTGITLTSGKAPLFCVFAVEGQEESAFKFIVREKDVFSPTILEPLGSHKEDSAGLLNFKQQVAITENNNYVLTFPNGINTPRYMYMEELDLLAFTSADVISHGSDVSLSVYGEPDDRKYRAYHSNGPYHTKMRILMLIENGGI